MTSIVKVSTARNILEQVKWKCKAYSSAFSTVLIVHILLSLLGGGGGGSKGYGRGFVQYQEQFYSLDSLFIFSIISCLIIGWIFASKQLSFDNYSIVTTGRTETISTFLVLCVLSLFTLISALSTLSISVFLEMFIMDKVFIFQSNMMSGASIVTFFLATLLAGTIGYFLHQLFDFSKGLLTLLVIVFVLFVRQFLPEFWNVVLGNDVVTVTWRLLLYIVVLWAIAFWNNQRKEVIRL